MAALVPAHAFRDLPPKLRDELLTEFAKIVQNFAERRWEPAELNAGKLCEVVYSIVRGYIDGKYPSAAKKPPRFDQACRDLEQTPSAAAPRSVRVQIPRMLVAMYEVRNNRNVGHVGGDVDPNHMDAVCVLQMAKWVVAELIRILHHLRLDDASVLVDALVERETPLVWNVGGKKRVLAPGMKTLNKTLLLLHATPGPVAEDDLVTWLEQDRASWYRRDVLRPAHKAKLIEYDAEARSAQLSPLGIKRVETTILPAARDGATS